MDEGRSELGAGDFSTKNKFSGFEKGELRAQGQQELEDKLGIRAPATKVFYYKGAKLPWLRRAFTSVNEPIDPFLGSHEHRGSYSHKYGAVFVKKDDPHAQAHELGHAFMFGINPEVEDSTRPRPQETERWVAYLAIYEGMAEWMAIATDIRTQIPERLEEARQRNNKLVAGAKDAQGFQNSPDVIAVNIAGLRKKMTEYSENLAVQRNIVPDFVRQEFEKLLDSDETYWQAMSLGYVYTCSRIKEGMGIEGTTVSDVLMDIAKRPPTLAQLEEIALTYDGGLAFDTLRISKE